MTLEDNKTVVRKHVQAWMTSDPGDRQTLFAEALAPDFSDMMPGGRRSRTELIERAAMLHSNGAEPSVTIHHMIAEGERVAVRATVDCRWSDAATGTHPHVDRRRTQ